MYFLKPLLSLILVLCMGFQLCLPVSAQSQPALISFQQSSDPISSTEFDYWLEASVAMAGSAAGNGAAFLSFLLLDLVPPIYGMTSTTKPSWVNADSPFLAFYLFLPILAAPLALYLFYPLPEGISADHGQTLLASLGAVLLHTALMIPVFLFMNQPNFSQNFYLAAPIAFFSALVLEGMATAWIFDRSRKLRLEQADNGLKLVYTLPF